MIKRHLIKHVYESLKYFPAVLINGARQVGKSTMIGQLVAEKLVDHYVSLDDLGALEAASADPDGFLSQFEGSVAIDEIQRVPDLMRALKKNIDQNRAPGRFLLTGSANILSYPGVMESLAGRMDIVTLEGLSMSELYLKKSPSDLLTKLFETSDVESIISYYRRKLKEITPLKRDAILEKCYFGGFPNLALTQQTDFTHRWCSSYQQAYIEKDVRNLNNLIDIVGFSKLLRLVGMRSGNLLNMNNLALDTSLDQRTVARYLEILKITFQSHELQPWHQNTKKRLVKMSKTYVNDSAIMCFLLSILSPNHLKDHPQLGAVVETWVYAELRKIIYATIPTQIYFYRTYLGKEVDFVLERGTQLWGIEIKFAESLTQKDFEGLKDFIEATSSSTTKGLILYGGQEPLKFSDSLIALPFSVLIG